ncbi:MAG: zinc ribbon domain-containing protein [Chloroflexi bacterium]|nr:zinc ribbon domain-containing protein [Chloroflexota bacterium]
MPTYEYRCAQCRRRNAYTVRGFNPPEAPACPHCGATDQKRLLTRVAVLRSEASRLDALADPTGLANFDEDDPRSVARMMRHMGDEAGEEMPPEFGEMVDRLEAGESPESIESSMGDQLDGALGGDLPA